MTFQSQDVINQQYLAYLNRFPDGKRPTEIQRFFHADSSFSCRVLKRLIILGKVEKVPFAQEKLSGREHQLFTELFMGSLVKVKVKPNEEPLLYMPPNCKKAHIFPKGFKWGSAKSLCGTVFFSGQPHGTQFYSVGELCHACQEISMKEGAFCRENIT